MRRSWLTHEDDDFVTDALLDGELDPEEIVHELRCRGVTQNAAWRAIERNLLWIDGGEAQRERQQLYGGMA